MRISVLFFILSVGSGYAQKIDITQTLQARQMVVVTTPSWTSTTGTLNYYELNAEGQWVLVVNTIPVAVGKTGLAWGKGLQAEQFNHGKLKREGDGKSPAGIFYLKSLYGYADFRSSLKYTVADSTTFCVDDVNSKYYNQIVTTHDVKKDWTSAEKMKRKDNLYKYGIVVDYNLNPASRGDGSCIFIHIWRSQTNATLGCTAMKETDLLRIIERLDKSKNPILVQAPADEYERLKATYILP